MYRKVDKASLLESTTAVPAVLPCCGTIIWLLESNMAVCEEGIKPLFSVG